MNKNGDLYLSIYLWTYLSVCLSINLLFYLSVGMVQNHVSFEEEGCSLD